MKYTSHVLAVSIASISGLSAQAQDAMRLDEVVVTATGFEQNILDAPATISVVTGEELKDKSYANITDALRHVAGVNIEGSGVEQGISIRGMDPEFTLFLIDGRPVSGGSKGSSPPEEGTPPPRSASDSTTRTGRKTSRKCGCFSLCVGSGR